jgi:general secretion pathway protein K
MSERRTPGGWRAARLAGSGRQQGIALLVAVLLVALGTIIAAAVAYENAMTARRGAGTYAFDEALLVAEGAEALAAYGLRQIHQNDPQKTYEAQGWAKPLGPIEVVPGVMLEASLEDLQSRFNLNNLVGQDTRPDPLQMQVFAQLLEAVGLEPKWSLYLADWISSGVNPAGQEGAKDNFYMGQSPPYRTANRYITSITELLALPAFGRERYLKLAPFVAALPNPTPLNVCTAKGAVLDAYLGAGHLEFTGTVENSRANTQGCFPTLADYRRAVPPGLWAGDAAHPAGGISRWLTQQSKYFRLRSFITIGSTEFNLYSLLYEEPNGAVRPIQRSFTPD